MDRKEKNVIVVHKVSLDLRARKVIKAYEGKKVTVVCRVIVGYEVKKVAQALLVLEVFLVLRDPQVRKEIQDL